MSGSRSDIARAEAAAAAARAQVQETVSRLRLRLDPRVRANEIWGEAREKGEAIADDAMEFAYERHRLIAGVAGAGLLMLVRKPALRLFARLRRPRRSKWDTPDREVRRIAPSGPAPAGSKGDLK